MDRKKKGIVFDKVSFAYDSNARQLDEMSLHIPEHAFFGITGTNGSGKSTMTMLLNGLIPHHVKGAYTGNVYVDGVNTRSKPVAYFASRIGMMFQNPDFMIFNLTVQEEIEFAIRTLPKSDKEKKITRALKIVGLSGFENRDPHSLSFGQKQKLCLACIIAMDPQYFVLDEPIAMLDYVSSVKLYEMLGVLHSRGKTIIVIEHDTDFLNQYANQMIVLNKGKIILSDAPKKIFNKRSLLNMIGIKIPKCL